MYFAAPIDYDTVMRLVPYGMLLTVGAIREYFAKQNDADFTEPITAGIFVSIAAWASYQRQEDPPPYWRILKANGELNPKYPGGIEAQKRNALKKKDIPSFKEDEKTSNISLRIMKNPCLHYNCLLTWRLRLKKFQKNGEDQYGFKQSVLRLYFRAIIPIRRHYIQADDGRIHSLLHRQDCRRNLR